MYKKRSLNRTSDQIYISEGKFNIKCSLSCLPVLNYRSWSTVPNLKASMEPVLLRVNFSGMENHTDEHTLNLQMKLHCKKDSCVNV